GSTTWAYFQYGPTTNYGWQTTPVNLGAGPYFIALTNGLTGLVPGTTTHFRIVATNALGAAHGQDATFFTPGAAGMALHFGRVFNYVYTTASYVSPLEFTLALWFKTPSTSVGLIGFGDYQGDSGQNSDRHIYLNSAGQVVFG